MIYLIFATVCSALITIVMRMGESRIDNKISMLAVNYFACLVLAMIVSAGSGSVFVPLDAESGGRMTIMLGLIAGSFYGCTIILYQYNIFRNGVVMSATFMKLSVLVPTLITGIAFGERLGALQVIGIVMAVAAILIVNGIGGRAEDGTAVQGAVTKPRALVGLLLSLANVPAVVAYPMFSVGTIIICGFAGVLAFHEKMTRRQWVAVGIIIAAMILLNI